MPQASGAGIKWSFFQPEPFYDSIEPTLQGDETDHLLLLDARILYISAYQTNDENASKNIEVHALVDGVEWIFDDSMDDRALRWFYKYQDIPDNTYVLGSSDSLHNAAYFTDFRGQSVEIWAVFDDAVVGTNQTLSIGVVYETLEAS